MMTYFHKVAHPMAMAQRTNGADIPQLLSCQFIRNEIDSINFHPLQPFNLVLPAVRIGYFSNNP